MRVILKSLLVLFILGVVSLASVTAYAYQRNMKYNESLEKQFPQPTPIVQNECYKPDGSFYLSTQPCEATAHLFTKDTPTAPSYGKTSPKTASNTQTEQTVRCTVMTGETLTIPVSLCDQLHAKENEIRELQQLEASLKQPAIQPTIKYDYYVPTFNYEAPNFEVDPPPTFEMNTPTYTAPNFETEPFPTIGPSVPIQNPECYVIGDKTVCK